MAFVTSDISGIPFDWGLAQLRDTLRDRGMLTHSGPEIRLHAPGVAPGALPLPDAPDSFCIVPDQRGLAVYGSTPRGLVYALLELAERVACTPDDPLHLAAPLVEQPAGKVRSMARFFCSFEEDRAWLYDQQMWCDYLTVLAANRFTGVSVNFGLQYNYPYYNRLITDTYLHFAYPFLVDVPGYDIRVTGLSDEERARNLAMLAFIAAEAARRGLDFRLGLWTHGYDFDDAENATYPIRGVTAENHAAYCRDALRALIAGIPDMTGVTVRVHVEAGVPEGSYDFWQTVFDGLREPGRPFTLDIHAKGTDDRMIGIALATGLPVTVSPKFMAEHSGLPYHQASVRRREMPRTDREGTMFALSEGSRRFLRYGYGDLLAAGRPFDVMVRVWPGTQRVLLSADPALAAAYGRAGVFCGASGIEYFEPLSFKGRMGSGRLGARFNYRAEELRPRYDWSKYEPMLILLGRLAYNPDAPAETWLRPLRALLGESAETCLAAVAPVSRALPLVTQVHGVSACNNTYWPEMYDTMSAIYPPAKFPYGYDSDGATRFGDVPTFDPQLFATPAETSAAIYAGRALPKYTPLDAARALDAFATESEAATRRTDPGQPAAQRILIDARMQAGLARFFAARFRSACALELYLLTGLRDAYLDTDAAYRTARAAWLLVTQVGQSYQDDLSYGPQPWLRGNWSDRLPAIDRDIEDLEFWYINDRDRHPEHPAAATAALDRLRCDPGVAELPLPDGVPTVFSPGLPLRLQIPLPSGYDTAVLYYRRVNQSEPWHSVPLQGAADIPAEYTQTAFPLQFYVAFQGPAGLALSPGLGADFCGVPYAVVMPRRD